MLKKSSWLLLLILTYACGNSKTSTSDGDFDFYNEPLIASEEGEPPLEANTFQTHLHFVNFNQDQEEKIQQASELIRKVIATQDFKDQVLGHRYQGTKTFSDSRGLTNLQIYNKILLAAEALQPTRNNALDVEIELYREDSSTIGYTYPNSKRIWMNLKYFERYSAVEVTDNLFHEWLHKLGFGHDSTPTAARPFSVPYALGYLMERLAQQISVASAL